MPEKKCVFEKPGDGNKKVICKKNGNLEYIFLLPEDSQKDLTMEKEIVVEEGGSAHVYFFYFGGKNVYSTVNINLKFFSQIQYNVIFFLDKKQSLRLEENYNFLQPHGFGRFITKGFTAGNACGEYCGNIVIEKDSQETDGRLEVHSFIMGQGAKCNMLPKLDIRANNVKAGHAASVSKIDGDNLFYLETRGIKKNDAIKLIIEGAFLDVTNRFSDPDIGDMILKMAMEKFDSIYYG